MALHLWHLTSLDAPTVAVCWTLGFAGAAKVRLPGWVPLLVALVVWAVYVADRLLDARCNLAPNPHGRGQERLQQRHLFHWRHRRALLPLAALAASAAAWILLTLAPRPVRNRDSLLGFAALAYFTRVHAAQSLGRRWRWRNRLRPIFTKELLVGLLFTADCLLPAWARAAHPAVTLAAPAVAFALGAWLNCALIDDWERDRRRAGGQRPPTLRWLALALVAGAFVCSLLTAGQLRTALLLAAAALSALLLAVLDSRRRQLDPLTLRALADLVLLTPWLAMGVAASAIR